LPGLEKIPCPSARWTLRSRTSSHLTRVKNLSNHPSSFIHLWCSRLSQADKKMPGSGIRHQWNERLDLTTSRTPATLAKWRTQDRENCRLTFSFYTRSFLLLLLYYLYSIIPPLSQVHHASAPRDSTVSPSPPQRPAACNPPKNEEGLSPAHPPAQATNRRTKHGLLLAHQPAQAPTN